MSKNKGKRIMTSNPEANKLIADMTEEEYKEWSKPFLAAFGEEFGEEVEEWIGR